MTANYKKRDITTKMSARSRSVERTDKNLCKTEKKTRSKSVPNIKHRLNINKSLFKIVFETIFDRSLSPILAAAECGYTELVKFLLVEGASRTTKNIFGMNCFHVAVNKGHCQLVEYLVEKQDFLYTLCMEKECEQPYGVCDGYTALHFAVDRGNLKMAEFLAKSGAQINKKDRICGRTPLMYAVQQANVPMIDLLLKYGADMKLCDKHKTNALHMATECYKYADLHKLFDVILKAGVDIDSRNKVGDTALHIACKSNAPNVVTILLKKRCQVDLLNFNNKTPLIVAIQEGCNTDIIKELLAFGASCDLHDSNGDTPLHIACQKDHLRNVDLILQKCSNVNVENAECCTPLLVAVKSNHIGVVKRLLEVPQIDIHCKNKNGESAVFIAVKESRESIDMLLIKAGADIHEREPDGSSLLHRATARGSLQIVKYLLNAGVDFDGVDRYGITPLDVAYDHDKSLIVKYLLDFGCDVNIMISNYKLSSRRVNMNEGTSIEMIFHKHFIRMECLGRHISNRLFEILKHTIYEFDPKAFRMKCLKEIEELKKLKLQDTNINVYSLLKKDKFHIIKDLENLSVSFEKDSYITKRILIYRTMIRFQIGKGMMRRSLLEKCRTNLEIIFDDLPLLPNICIELILQNFTIRELHVVASMFTPNEKLRCPIYICPNFSDNIDTTCH